MEIETLDETVSQKIRRGAFQKLAYELKKVDVVAVNAKVVEMNPQPLVDTGKHIKRDVGRDTWQHASKVDAKVVVWQTNSQRWTS